MECVRVNSQSTEHYAVGGTSTQNEIGMLTGCTAINCEFDAPLALQVGNCQDDFTAIGTRFCGGNVQMRGELELLGNNIKMTGTYLFLQEMDAQADDGAITIGPNPVDIDGLFVEGSTNLAWLFNLPFDEARFWLKRLQMHLDYTGSSANAALVHTAIGANAVYKQIHIDGVRRKIGSLDAWPHVGNFRWASPDSGFPAWVTIGGLEEFSSPQFFSAASGGYTNTNKLLRVMGFHNGATWCKEAASDMIFS